MEMAKLKLQHHQSHPQEKTASPHDGNYLMPVFGVSLCAIIFEIALTRYFAIANWSEYGYWVISITMVGFSFSGVILSLFKDFFERHSQSILYALPILMMAAVSVGYHFITINPFNPLELQNPLFWFAQFLNICKYYLALFPFFFHYSSQFAEW